MLLFRRKVKVISSLLLSFLQHRFRKKEIDLPSTSIPSTWTTCEIVGHCDISLQKFFLRSDLVTKSNFLMVSACHTNDLKIDQDGQKL